GRAGSGRQWTAESGDQAAVRAGSQRQRGSDGVGDVLDQRESPTEAPSAGGGSGVRAAVEGLAQLSGFLAAPWWAVVGHLDPYLCVVLARDDVHRAAVNVVLDSVVDQVLDGQRQQSLVGGGGAGSAELSSDGEVPILDVLLVLREALIDDRRELGPSCGPGARFGSRRARESQECRDELLTALVCFQCAPDRGHEVLGDLALFERDLQRGARGRQWRAQLVGGVGDETLLLGERRLEPVEHGVDRVAELLDLVGRTRQVEPLV